MENKKVLKISLLLIGVLLISIGVIYLVAITVLSNVKLEGEPIYYLDDVYDFNNGAEAVVNQDFDGERFIYTYLDKNNKQEKMSFYFSINCNSLSADRFSLKNSNEFTYTDSEGNEIVFDEHGYYNFQGNKKIYISYKNASEKTKTAIKQGEFSINCGYVSLHARKEAYNR